MADPLAEAMSMLDAVTNGESFDDFAIDSDDENLQDLDLGSDLLADTDDEGGEKVCANNKADTSSGGAEGNQTDANTVASGGTFEHPLQMLGLGGLDPLSQANQTGAVNAMSGPISQGGDDITFTPPVPISGGEFVVLSADKLYLNNLSNRRKCRSSCNCSNNSFLVQLFFQFFIFCCSSNGINHICGRDCRGSGSW
jgi:hypothetical protein